MYIYTYVRTVSLTDEVPAQFHTNIGVHATKGCTEASCAYPPEAVL